MRANKSLCSECGIQLTEDNAYKNKRGHNGLDSKCKSCKKGYATKRTADYRQTLRGRAIHQESVRRRQLPVEQVPSLTNSEREEVLSLYSEATRLTQETGIQHEVDHIQPVSKGGIHHPSNLQILTTVENRRKHNYE